MKLLDILFESVVDMEEGRKSMSKDEFVRRSKEVHDNYYSYDNVNYIGSKTKVNITCPIHGDFPQRPYSHLSGSVCDECGIISKTSNKEEFIQRSQSMKVHQHKDGTPKYTYDNVEYKGSHINVNITCPIHGDFPQSPNSHLRGAGCDKCARDKRRYSQEEFIQRAQSMKVHQHKDGTPKYTYDNVEFIDVKTKVNITCPIHSPKLGDFPQSPNSHLKGIGCPWCNESKGEKRISQILFKKNIESIPFKKYDDCISYRSRNGLSKRCHKLEFDFYLPENNTLVEYDGEYHFKQMQKVSLEQYRYNVLNDREKNEYTKAKNIKFIRIGYLDKENIEEELMKGLDSNDQLYLSTKYPIDKGWRDTTIKV